MSVLLYIKRELWSRLDFGKGKRKMKAYKAYLTCDACDCQVWRVCILLSVRQHAITNSQRKENTKGVKGVKTESGCGKLTKLD